jgi:hypothetical protein
MFGHRNMEAMMAEPHDDQDYGAPPHLCLPDGALDDRRAWLKAVIEKAEASPLVEGTVDDLFDRVKRRGRENLAKSKRAA